MLSDHRAVYDTKCGRPQRGRGGGQMRTPADRGEEGYKKGPFFADVLYGRPLSRSLPRISPQYRANVHSLDYSSLPTHVLKHGEQTSAAVGVEV